MYVVRATTPLLRTDLGFLSAHTAFPAPSDSQGETIQKLGRTPRSEDAETHYGPLFDSWNLEASLVIARTLATKAIHVSAMAYGLLPYARTE